MAVNIFSNADLVAEVKMVRTAFSGAILLVEGKDDRKLFAKFFNSSQGYILPTIGRERLLDALSKLNKENFKGVLGIVDADHWRLQGNIPNTKNLAVSDYHDMELVILASSALDDLLREYASIRKIESFIKSNQISSARDWLMLQAAPLGKLRLISHRESLALDFKKLKFSKVLDRNTLILDINNCVRRILLLHNPTSANHDHIIKKFEDIKVDSDNIWQLCCGHDVIEILAEALKRAWATLPASKANEENLSTMLRLAFSFEDFQNTLLFESILRWEKANPSFRISPKLQP